MTLTESFKNGLWVHSPAVLDVPPDACFYRVAAGRYAFGDTTSPATYVAANRGLEIGVGAAPVDFAAAAGALTVTMRTQSAGGVGPSNGGDLILLTGNPTGAGRRGYFNVTGAGAGAQTTMIGATAGGLSTGSDCTFLGFAAGRDMVAGISGTFIGSQAGLTATGNNNTAIGAAADIEVVRFNNVVIGSNASAAAGSSNVVIGGFADLDAAGGVLIGGTGVLSANQSVAIGSNINVISAFSVTLGDSAYNPAASSIVIGHGATTSTANTMVCGSSTDPINILYGGKGEKAAAPTAWMVSGTAPRDGTDVDTNGGDLHLAGGRGTGNGLCGDVDMAFSRVVGAGSGAQTNETCLAFRGHSTPAIYEPAVNTNSGATMYTRTQRGGSVGNTTGGNWIVQLGSQGTAAAAGTRRGYFNVTGVTAGVRTTFIGEDAGNLATGDDLVCLGYWSLYQTTTGNLNTAAGALAGFQNTTGIKNTYFGYSAGGRSGVACTGTGSDNVFVGYRAGNGNSATMTVQRCVFIGSDAGRVCTSSSDSVMIGWNAGTALIGGGSNVGVGAGALAGATSGSYNVAIGTSALGAQTTVTGNTAVGYQAGLVNSSGSSNIFIGTQAGLVNTTGSNNIHIGISTSGTTVGANNEFVVGSTTSPATSIFFGGGPFNNTPSPFTLYATSAATLNNVGSDMTFVSGRGRGTGACGVIQFQVSPTSAGSGVLQTPSTVLLLTQTGRLVHTLPSNTGKNLTASTESIGVHLDESLVRTFGTGALSLQRAVAVDDPSYAFVGASTITDARTFSITGAPHTGANATITQAWAFYAGVGAFVTSGQCPGVARFSTVTTATETNSRANIRASTECTDVIFDLSGTTTWNTGALALQRAFRITAPTYAFNGASTLTEARTISISGAPIQGANATITDSWALVVMSGAHTAGKPHIARFQGEAHTGLVASECADVTFQLDRTVQFTGNTGFALQRAVNITTPTYAFAAATGTIATAATFYVGAAPIAGANCAITNSYSGYFNGPCYVNGKLTVTGGVDPTYMELAGTANDTYLNMTDGSSVPVSGGSEGRICYFPSSGFKFSRNGGAYENILPGTVTTDQVIIGTGAAAVPTSGACVAIGTAALASATLSQDCVAVGNSALYGLLTDGANVAVGFGASNYRTYGAENVAIGQAADSGATGNRAHVGAQNVCIGAYAGMANAGADANKTFASSVLVGWSAGLKLSTGDSNVFIGSSCAAGGSEITGGSNVCVGGASFSALTSGGLNAVVGHAAAVILADGANNVIFGAGADVAAADAVYATGLGSYSIAHGGSVVLGGAATSTASAQFVAGSTTYAISDVYFGKGVRDATPSDYTINGTEGYGSDVAAGNLFLAGGRSTGNATPGALILKTCITQASGTDLNALCDRVHLASVNNANLHSDVSLAVKTYEAAALTLLSITEEVTLTGVTTDSSLNLLPANSFIVGVTTRVTTTLPNARTWKAGTSITLDLFVAAGTSGTAGQTDTSFAQTTASVSPFINQTAAPVRITASNADAANGKIRITVFYYTLTAPGS